jgi:prevent-host-death family protein
MKRVNSREARNKFSQLMNEAAAGTVIEVMRRGKVLAVIGPPKPTKLKRLPSMAAFRASIKVRGKPMSEELREMRNEGR